MSPFGRTSDDPLRGAGTARATRPELPESSPARAEYVDLLGYADTLEAALERYERLSWKRAAVTVAMTEKAPAVTKRAEVAEAALVAATAENERLRSWLRQALDQISEFRRTCDPREEHVIVSQVEFAGDAALAPSTEKGDGDG